MTTAVTTYKNKLQLKQHGEQFFDYVCEYFNFSDFHNQQYIISQLNPWFGIPDESTEPFENFDTHSQFYSEYVHQKYRIILEFCAHKAGYENTIVYDSDTGIPMSGNYFWLKDYHPNPVSWVMTDGDKVITRGSEEPNTLNIETLDSWIVTRILNFTSIRANNE